MIYFANPSTELIREAVRAGRIGIISTPKSTRQSQKIPSAYWCADNGCYGKDFNIDRWWAWLEEETVNSATCAFATAPDVVANHQETLDRSLPWLPRIRDLGYRAAFVAQDGSSTDTIPWSEFDVLFIGGSTEWKLGKTAQQIAQHAKTLDMWVHMGRVNSAKRLFYADSIGCDSVDGTYLTFGPDINLSRLLNWLDRLEAHPTLFTMSGEPT